MLDCSTRRPNACRHALDKVPMVFSRAVVMWVSPYPTPRSKTSVPIELLQVSYTLQNVDCVTSVMQLCGQIDSTRPEMHSRIDLNG